MIVVICSCGARHELPDEWAGKRGRCPKCKRVLHVPAKATKKEETPPAPVAPTGPPEPAARTAPSDPTGGVTKQADPEITGFTFDYDEFADRDRVEKVEKEKKPEPAKKPDRIRFRCSCGKVLVAPAQRAGATARCPKCRKMLVVPTPKSPEDEWEDEKKQDGKQLADLFGYENPEGAAKVTCDHCGADMAPGAIVCVQCGINRLTGAQLKTVTGPDAEIPGDGPGLLGKVAFWKRKKKDVRSYRTVAEDKKTKSGAGETKSRPPEG